MTKYTKLKTSPVTVRTDSVYGAFAGMCALLMVSCALAGLAMSTKGADSMCIDLVAHEGAGLYEWRVLDRDLDPSTGGTFELRKPVATADGGLSFVFNDVSSGELSDLYTVYMVRYGELDMTGAAKIEAEISMSYTGDLPTMVCRNPKDPWTAWQYVDSTGALIYYQPFVRLHFLSASGESWTCSDYWWSRGTDGVQFAYLRFNPDMKTASWTLSVSLADLASWSDRDGHDAGDTYDDGYNSAGEPLEDDLDHVALFSEAVGNVREIGLSFGGGSMFANGAGVLGSTSLVTFELDSYTISWP